MADEQCVNFYWADCCTSNEAQEPVITASSAVGMLSRGIHEQLSEAQSCLAQLDVTQSSTVLITDCKGMIRLLLLPADPPAGVQAQSSAFCIEGQMKASKGRQGEHAANTVHVMICVLRIPHVSSDIVITLSTPISVSENSAAAADAGSGDRTDHLRAPALFNSMIHSFAINDWGLFGES